MMIDWEAKIERRLHAENDANSHVELDPVTFHPSQISRCGRTCLKSKFGLDEHDTSTLGTFKLGTMIHSWFEDHYSERIDGIEMETDVELERGGVRFVGAADVYDSHENVVYDFKTRSGWYKFDPPDDAHRDQLTVYMAALGATHGQVVYISKKNLEVRTWPEDGLFEYDESRLDELIGKAVSMKEAIRDYDQLPESPADITDMGFGPCGCWICGQEDDVNGVVG